MKKLLVYVAASFLITSCAVFQGNEIGHINPASQGSITGASRLMTYNIVGNVENTREDFLISTMSKYNWELKPRPVKKDGVPHLQINLSFKRNGAAVVPAILTGLTLYVIPSWQTQKYTLTAQSSDSKNNDEYYTFKDHTTLVQWLPMMFAFPFAFPGTAEGNLIENMYENLAYKINQETNVATETKQDIDESTEVK